MTLPFSLTRNAEAVESYFGIYAGIVEEIDDRDGRARIRVRLRWIADDYITEWVPVAQIYAGNGYGAYWIPESGDQVVIAFLRGQLRSPVVIGSLYSQKSLPKTARGSGSDPKYFRTAGGHMLLMEDGKGRRIELVDGTGRNSVVIDSEANSIMVKAAGDVTVEAAGNLTLKATNVKIEASGGSVTVSGNTINLN